ncbi:FYVE, RhoGEF and PH domain-containing protein 3 [Bombina bombina]|uniref:FYVE, RhoGEF and PH domain-containing protein 3 n=1 Tax=Bombina bombina TaxID=8345 RepID=UPI00235B261F|nr:FYVE, RhoGEF and PH domain-containing protein 3 [Bombina bombina]
MNKMTGNRSKIQTGADGCYCATFEIKCHIESNLGGKLQKISPGPCIQQTGRKSKTKPPPIKKPALEKPQVPPKPAHLKAGIYDRPVYRIPPAPCRPLPSVPKTTRRPGIKERNKSELSDVSILIEKFESIRQPVQFVQQTRLNIKSLKMEQGSGQSKYPHLCGKNVMDNAENATAEHSHPDDNERAISQSSEIPNSDALKFQELSITDFKNCGQRPTVSLIDKTSRLNGNDIVTVDHNDNGKMPNRDSGIDSPSCSVVGEVFSSDEGVEHKKMTVSATEVGNDNKHNHSSVDQKRDSTQDEDSDLDEGSSEEQEAIEVPTTESIDSTKCTEPQKLFNIANELLHTEEAYVKRLHLLDQVFCTKLVGAGIPQDVTTGIFSNISSIYCFHGQFLLPQLKDRITQEWDTNPRIGDILQKLAPFLKMYGEYVKNFDKAMDMVNTWTQRSATFKEVIHTIQKEDVCGNLTLQHHMLEPVQRIPRYELLLKDYLKKLPEDSPDRKDSEKSLELISTAANHSNAAIRKMEKMNKLLEVYERLGGEEDIVNPANELIKEGHIQKLSAKNGTTQDRYLYLFNSMLLYCVPKLRLMGQKFSVREKIDIAGIQVQDIVKPNTSRTFLITGKTRSLELQARTEEEKKDWIQVIQATFEKHKQNSETFKAFNSSFSREDEHCPDSPLATPSSFESTPGSDSCSSPGGADTSRKSSKIKRDKEKQSCKWCGESFNSITKRRHHCKQCGAVICAKCSEFKLLVENGRLNRVCKDCFQLSCTGPCSAGGIELAGTEPKKKVTAEKQNSLTPENSVFSSSLLFLEKGKAWHKLWVSIPKNEPLVMQLHGCSQDSRTPRTIPLPGYEVSFPSSSDKVDLKHVFKLSQSQHTIFFGAEDEDLLMKWMDILYRVSKGDTSDLAETFENP